MSQFPKKRKSTIDLTGDDEARPAKTPRDMPYLSPSNASTGQRFGEATEFIPMTQVPDADDDDAEATSLMPDGQDVDESAMSTNILYGRHSYLIFTWDKNGC